MLLRTHIAFSFLVGLYLSNILNFNSILFVSFVLIGTLVVDIDTPKSKLGKRLKPVSYPIAFIFGHRGFFHSIWIPFILFLVYLYLFDSYVLIALIVGYLSHILMDSLTKEGINLLHPLTTLRIQGFIKTGSFLEHIVFALFIIFNILALYVL